jgi:dolichol-phosphate mannosyltransferase
LKRTLVIIPTYNEADNILKIIPEVLKNTTPENEFNVLVVDDNSPDGTASMVEGLK